MKRRGHMQRNRPRPKRKAPRLFLAAAICLGMIILLQVRLRPMVEEMATYQVKVYATKTINDALMEELAESQIRYDDLVHISQDGVGQILSIQTDVVAVNRLKSQMVQGIASRLEEMGPQSIYVPLGTLLGNEWFSGRGPGVEIKVLPDGYVQSDLYNSFTSAGINQTHHQVMLQMTVQSVVILPGYSIKAETTSSICIAETVIVGSIPDAFIQINSDSLPVIAKIGD